PCAVGRGGKRQYNGPRRPPATGAATVWMMEGYRPRPCVSLPGRVDSKSRRKGQSVDDDSEEKDFRMATIPIALTIAGSDSGGGAGIQADLKTFHAFGAFGASAVTAVTVQNTRGVTGVHPIPVDVVRAQIRAVAEDLPPAACKTGMLATSELVSAVAASIRERRLPNFVLDPVMVASSGDRLL